MKYMVLLNGYHQELEKLNSSEDRTMFNRIGKFYSISNIWECYLLTVFEVFGQPKHSAYL